MTLSIDNEGPDIPLGQQVQAPALLHRHPFDFHLCIRRLCGNTTTMFEALEQLDLNIPPGPIFVHSERAEGGVSLRRQV